MPNSHYISLPSAIARGRLGISESSYSTLRQLAMSTVRTLQITTKRECPPSVWDEYESTLRYHPLLEGVREFVGELEEGEEEDRVVRVDEGLKTLAEEADRAAAALGEDGGAAGPSNGMERDEEGKRKWGGDEGKVTRKEAREAFLWLLVRSLNSVQGREREKRKKEEDVAVAGEVLMGGMDGKEGKETAAGKKGKKKEKRRWSQVQQNGES